MQNVKEQRTEGSENGSRTETSICHDTIVTLEEFLRVSMMLVSVSRISQYAQIPPGERRTRTVFGVVVRDEPALMDYFSRALEEPLTHWLGSGNVLEEFALTMHWAERRWTESFVFRLEWTDTTLPPQERALYAARNKDAQLIINELNDMQSCLRKLQSINTVIVHSPIPEKPTDVTLTVRTTHSQTSQWHTAVSSDIQFPPPATAAAERTATPTSSSSEVLPIKTVIIGIITVHIFATFISS